MFYYYLMFGFFSLVASLCLYWMGESIYKWYKYKYENKIKEERDKVSSNFWTYMIYSWIALCIVGYYGNRIWG
jgi:hypothetical protein